MRKKISISSIKKLTFTVRLKVSLDTRIHIDDENICRDDDSIEEINEEEEDIIKQKSYLNDRYSTRSHMNSNRSKHNQNIDLFFQERVENRYRNTWVKKDLTNLKYDIEENYIENIKRWWETKFTIKHIDYTLSFKRSHHIED